MRTLLVEQYGILKNKRGAFPIGERAIPARDGRTAAHVRLGRGEAI